MGMSKIKYWEAESISRSIANKAFEHLIAPTDDELQAHLKVCYEHCLDVLSVDGRVDLLLSLDVLQEAECVAFKFPRPFVDEGDSVRYREAVYAPMAGGKLMLCPNRACWRVEDDTLVAQFFALMEKQQPLFVSRGALAKELMGQIENKSAKHIMKVWPESAPIVAEYFGIDVVTGRDISMTTPLENLLAKYLTPLLAAPQGA